MFRHAFGRQVFIRPIIEERSAEMEGFEKDLDGAPVRQPVLFDFVLIFLLHLYDGEHRVTC
jgi:hypothetical protein